MKKIILIAVFVLVSVTSLALQPPSAPPLPPAYSRPIIRITEPTRTHYTAPTGDLNLPEKITFGTGVTAIGLEFINEFLTAGEHESVEVVYPGSVYNVPLEPTVRNPPGVHVTPHLVIVPSLNCFK